MRHGKDYQKSRCYRWEDQHIAPLGGGTVPFSQAQAFVNHVWESEGLEYPPQVKLMNESVNIAATGCRLEIEIPAITRSWILIHEIAHSMTSDFNGRSAGHGPAWVGVYIKLACKYLGGDMLALMHTARISGVDFDITASPKFVD